MAPQPTVEASNVCGYIVREVVGLFPLNFCWPQAEKHLIQLQIRGEPFL